MRTESAEIVEDCIDILEREVKTANVSLQHLFVLEDERYGQHGPCSSVPDQP
jgi:hypothetical protein